MIRSRALFGFLGGVLGAGATYLIYATLSRYGVIGPEAGRMAKDGPGLEITYSDFISFMLSSVTLVLAILAIIIGTAAFWTIREIKADARKTVRTEVKREMEKMFSEMERSIYERGVNTRAGDELHDEDEEER